MLENKIVFENQISFLRQDFVVFELKTNIQIKLNSLKTPIELKQRK